MKTEEATLSLSDAYLKGLGYALVTVGSVFGYLFLHDLYNGWVHGSWPSQEKE